MKNDNRKFIYELDKLRHKIIADKKMKTMLIIEDIQIIENNCLEEL